jgi:hypothetical protein
MARPIAAVTFAALCAMLACGGDTGRSRSGWLLMAPPMKRTATEVTFDSEMPVSEWERLSVFTFKSASGCREELVIRRARARATDGCFDCEQFAEQLDHARCVEEEAVYPPNRTPPK